jgi:hypothetical protein
VRIPARKGDEMGIKLTKVFSIPLLPAVYVANTPIIASVTPFVVDKK